MRLFKKWYVKIVIFTIGLCIIEAVMEFAFFKWNDRSFLFLHQFQQDQEECQIVAVGNSLGYTQVDPYVLEEQLGLSAYCIGLDAGRSDSYLSLIHI